MMRLDEDYEDENRGARGNGRRWKYYSSDIFITKNTIREYTSRVRISNIQK